MDPVTHGLVGATLSQSLASNAKVRAASITGFFAAMAADLDVFITANSDPLLNLEMHRQFTHSFVFIPVGSFLSAMVIWWFVKKHLSLKETYLFCLAGFSTAGIMDYFTSYGVHLLWPFADERYSLDLLSVFDPFFSGVLVTLAAIGFYNRQKRYPALALCWIAAYLLFAFSQQQKAAEQAEVLAGKNGHTIQQLVVKPTIANQLLWSIRYIHDDRIYAYGIRMLPFTDPKVYKGASVPLLQWKTEYSAYKGSILYEDIRRFSKLSNGYLVRHPQHKDVIGDGRYAILPTSPSPLWGIKIDTTKPGQHVRFETYRDADAQVRRTFLNMLLGR